MTTRIGHSLCVLGRDERDGIDQPTLDALEDREVLDEHQQFEALLVHLHADVGEDLLEIVAADAEDLAHGRAELLVDHSCGEFTEGASSLVSAPATSRAASPGPVDVVDREVQVVGGEAEGIVLVLDALAGQLLAHEAGDRPVLVEESASEDVVAEERRQATGRSEIGAEFDLLG